MALSTGKNTLTLGQTGGRGSSGTLAREMVGSGGNGVGHQGQYHGGQATRLYTSTTGKLDSRNKQPPDPSTRPLARPRLMPQSSPLTN